MARKKTCAELETEVAHLQEKLNDFMNPDKAKLVGFTEQGMPVIKYAMVPLIAESFAQLLVGSGAENYLEQSFESKTIGNFLMTLQHPWPKKTPHQLRKEAEAERDTYKALLTNLAQLDCECGVPCDCWSWTTIRSQARDALGLPDPYGEALRAIAQQRKSEP